MYNIKIKKNMEKLTKLIKEYKTKHEGFYSLSEKNDIVSKMLELYPEANIEKFDDALTCVTAQTIDDITYFYAGDIHKGLICAVENRDLNVFEWD